MCQTKLETRSIEQFQSSVVGVGRETARVPRRGVRKRVCRWTGLLVAKGGRIILTLAPSRTGFRNCGPSIRKFHPNNKFWNVHGGRTSFNFDVHALLKKARIHFLGLTFDFYSVVL